MLTILTSIYIYYIYINKGYKKATQNTVKDETKKDKEIASALDLDDRIYSTSKRQAFITLKDHKPNFQNAPKLQAAKPNKK